MNNSQQLIFSLGRRVGEIFQKNNLWYYFWQWISERTPKLHKQKIRGALFVPFGGSASRPLANKKGQPRGWPLIWWARREWMLRTPLGRSLRERLPALRW